MVFNDELIFIHIGKTGGMSCSRFLLENLKPTVYNCHPGADNEIGRWPKMHGALPLCDTHRHWTLAQSLDYLNLFNGKGLDDFKKVVAVVRDPLSLEYSFFTHLQKPHVREQRGLNAKPLFDLADGDFLEFVKRAGYHAPGLSQDDFVRLDGEIPDCVELVKFESLDPDFENAVKPFLREDADEGLRQSNRSAYKSPVEDLVTNELIDSVYKKHQYMYDSGMYSLDNYTTTSTAVGF